MLHISVAFLFSRTLSEFLIFLIQNNTMRRFRLLIFSCLLLTGFPLLAGTLPVELDSIFRVSLQTSPNRKQLTEYQKKVTDTLDNSRTSTVAEAYLQIAEELNRQEETAASLLIANRITQELQPTSQKELLEILAKSYHLTGKDYINLGNTTQALKNFQEAIETARQIGSERLLASIYNNMFQIYYERKDFKNAMTLLEQSLEYHLRTNDSLNILTNYNNMGLVFYEEHEYDKAINYLKKAYSYAAPTDSLRRSQIHTNLAEVYFMQGRMSHAEKELQSAVDLRKGSSQTGVLQTWLNMATLKAAMGKNSESLKWQKDIVRHLSMSTSLKQQANAFLQLADTRFIMGDSIQGLRYLLTYERLNDSLKAVSSNAQLQQLLIAYDTERLQQNNDKLQQSLNISQLKVKNRTLTIYGSIAFATVLVVLIVFLLKKMKSDREKKRIIDLQNEQIALYEKREHERQKQELSREIDHKNRQLTSYTIDLAANSEFHQQIYNSLEGVKKNISKESPDTIKDINDILHRLQHFNKEQVGKDFRVFFDEVHPDFLNKLSLRYPQLSKNDLRLCAYLHLGMTTKEIAALTFREIRSVESSRNRLRKKLELPPETSLQNFLTGLFTEPEEKMP